MAVAYHELREYLVCKHKGIRQQEVDSFDMSFSGEGEPGDDPKAPYFLEHQYATRDERLLVSDLGLDWNEYEESIEKLSTTCDTQSS